MKKMSKTSASVTNYAPLINARYYHSGIGDITNIIFEQTGKNILFLMYSNYFKVRERFLMLFDIYFTQYIAL